ncbi:unnamed protein product [Adineta steineri]|uniref:Uncharacterized protein n=1 Tax=Adineta steineri TaxID=433720 RepID=A0A814B7P2_9BILA|nr:unnamed protein product [Adineta steineri]
MFTFSNISDHVDAVLLAYNTYQLNFRSIQKDHFDLICKRIRCLQVISLVLSDENDTPAQSELFFSRLPIEQFSQLQTLTLINIEGESLKWIFPNLYKLNLLRSLTFLDFLITEHPYQHQTTEMQSLIYESFAQIVPRLNRIHLTNGTFLSSIPCPYLRHLNLEKCSINDLKTVFQHSNQLRSFFLCLDMHNSSTFDQISFLIQLIRLHLKIEKLLGLQDLFDGDRW